MHFLKKIFRRKRNILVISWWWVRGFYAMWIFKALEELDMKKNISAIYWVSAWAIVWTYRSAWYSADQIFEKFSKISPFGLKKINFLSKKSLLKNDFLQHIFEEDLPKSFKELSIPISIWTTDSKSGKYVLYNKGELILPLLGSMAIPGVFPPTIFQENNLMDWWLINNFPVDIAKEEHPHHRIIWIFLNKFVENQKTSSIIQSLSISYEILMRAKDREKFYIVDDLFYRDLNIPILSNNKKQIKKIFDWWYEDWIEKFW